MAKNLISQHNFTLYLVPYLFKFFFKVHFMFGGNPGGKQGKEDKLRLGDFWKLQLQRPGREEVLRRCKILIRQSKFSELAAQDQMLALKYLHTSLSSVVDHQNSKEEREVNTY